MLSDFLEACNIFQKVKEIAQNAINLSVSKFIGTGLLTLIQLVLSNWLQELHILVSTVFKWSRLSQLIDFSSCFNWHQGRRVPFLGACFLAAQLVMLRFDVFNYCIELFKLLQVLDEEVAVVLIKSGSQSTESQSCQSERLLVLLLELVEDIFQDELLLEDVVTRFLLPGEKGD